MDNVTKKERVFYLDLMRIIAIFNVIILHIAAYFWAEQPINSYNFNIMTMYDSLVRFCVPLFVMISGILWLNPKKEVDIKNIYRKNILKIVIAFIFWSSIYSALEVLFLGGIGIEEFIWKCVTGHYHMWFLYMIIGLYIITPLIRKITEDEKLTKYFLVISFVTGICVPTLKDTELFERIIEISKNFNIYIGMGYIFYFVFGYYISKKDINKGIRYLIYMIGIISGFAIYYLTNQASIKYNMPVEYYFDYLNGFVAAESLAAFTFIKSISRYISNNKIINLLVKVSGCSFGIYLIHDLVIQLLLIFNLKSTSFNPVFSIPLIAIIVFCISFLLTWLIGKIKGAKRYII